MIIKTAGTNIKHTVPMTIIEIGQTTKIRMPTGMENNTQYFRSC